MFQYCVSIINNNITLSYNELIKLIHNKLALLADRNYKQTDR